MKEARNGDLKRPVSVYCGESGHIHVAIRDVHTSSLSLLALE